MQPDKQPFEVWLEIDELQIPTVLYPLRVAAGVPVRRDSVGIDKNERSTVPYAAFVAATPLVDGILDDHSTIAATGHDYVEMKTETLVIA